MPSPTHLTLARRAASIVERAAALRDIPADVDSAAVHDVVRVWAETFSPGDSEAFERRLGWDGLDRTDAARIAALHESPHFVPGPDWTDWLTDIANEASGVLTDVDRGQAAELAPGVWADEPPFVELWLPIVRAARARLRREARPETLEHAIDAAHRDLEHQLSRELALTAERTIYTEFDRYRQAHGPAGAYRAFVNATLADGFERLWLSYPVMARQVAMVAGFWVDSTREWLERLDADARRLGDLLFGGADPGPALRLEPALSDPHHGRRRVMIVHFDHGHRAVYKPRDVELERAFSDLLGWAADRGLSATPRALRVLPCDGYGWVEFAESAADRSTAEAADYFRRAGGALCLAHVLRGRDLHMGNVVATDQGPALIDVEMLLQPERRAGLSAGGDDEGGGAHPVIESCLTTGLLSHFDITGDGHVVDVGGLRGTGQGQRSRPKRVWRAHRSDELHVTEERQFDAWTPNRVRCGGVDARADEFADHILDGFDAAYAFVLAEREALLAADGPLAAFARCRARVIPRPTDQYAMLATTLLGPRYQTDGARRSAAMDILSRPFRRATSRPAVWPLLREERRALEALDIPYFAVPCDGTAVLAGSNRILDDYFTDSGLSVVRTRIASMSETDRELQRRVLARALGESPSSRLSPAPPALPPDTHPAGAALATAVWVGHVVRDLPAPDGLALYDGAMGPAVLFAALGAVTGDESWTAARETALAPVYRAIASDTVVDQVGGRVGVGDGLASLIYGLTLIAGWSRESAPLEAAKAVAAALMDQLGPDMGDDVLSGAAGAMLGLLALDAQSPSVHIRTAVENCARHLVARADREGDLAAWRDPDGRRLVGFAHGAAGIGYALARAAGITNQDGASAVAAGAVRFWRACYQPGQRNWPIAAATGSDDRAAATMMTAWCHGAPGLAIAESALEPADREKSQLEAALNTTAAWSAARADHLCCGTLGRADVLLTLGRRLGADAAVTAGVALARHAVARAFGAGHFRLSTPGFEYRVRDAGFFRGLSGIGYVLARFAAPDRLPSVLAFDPLPLAKDVTNG